MIMIDDKDRNKRELHIREALESSMLKKIYLFKFCA